MDKAEILIVEDEGLVAEGLRKKKNIVVIFPDSGERYFSFKKLF